MRRFFHDVDRLFEAIALAALDTLLSNGADSVEVTSGIEVSLTCHRTREPYDVPGRLMGRQVEVRLGRWNQDDMSNTFVVRDYFLSDR
jgi:hypothetical protein